ncbi:hypothetical protein RM780_24870 [Streptomyces sp. DSM 44917]|uniref:Uncharacterized protein n=1 Tax=Streptomyces boetiae TaxID=3075541 RepID=A0ABU2LFZ3_9ACTN|nr:hypothetical protein [Streptomyces sp. DSM 44917]MDT0310162.1 hypothetical protein [Streptomyces sp. DSM 44917]
MDTSRFPQDLIAAQHAWYDLDERLARLPARPAGDPGGAVDDGERERRLHARLQELSLYIAGHPFWETLPGGVVAARIELKRRVRAERAARAGARGRPRAA